MVIPNTFSELSEYFQNSDNFHTLQTICKFNLPWLLQSTDLSGDEYETLLKFAIASISKKIVSLGGDEKHQIAETIRLIERLLPEDNFWKGMDQIQFSEDDRRRGLIAIQSCDMVMRVDGDKRFVVPQKTTLILRLLEIPYDELMKGEDGKFYPKRLVEMAKTTMDHTGGTWEQCIRAVIRFDEAERNPTPADPDEGVIGFFRS